MVMVYSPDNKCVFVFLEELAREYVNLVFQLDKLLGRNLGLSCGSRGVHVHVGFFRVEHDPIAVIFAPAEDVLDLGGFHGSVVGYERHVFRTNLLDEFLRVVRGNLCRLPGLHHGEQGDHEVVAVLAVQ